MSWWKKVLGGAEPSVDDLDKGDPENPLGQLDRLQSYVVHGHYKSAQSGKLSQHFCSIFEGSAAEADPRGSLAGKFGSIAQGFSSQEILPMAAWMSKNHTFRASVRNAGGSDASEILEGLAQR